jgi:16S rRNA (guanine527-N7)-methyltransferase
MSQEFRERLSRWASLREEQVAALEAHYDLLCRWNKVLNLTRIERLDEAVDRHYGESLFVAQHLPAGELRICDIGSGAGFPGFPVAVARPECTVTLIESHQRKAVFLREASRGLPNVRVLARRAEDVDGGFDWAISRAVSAADLAEVLARLAARAALLVGEDVIDPELGLEWQDPVQLPSGKHRFLLVSRETNVV